jgi:TRAP-type transport system periplasmic protein
MPLIYKQYQVDNDNVMAEAAGHGVTFHEPSEEMATIIGEFEKNNITRAIAVGKEKKMAADPEKFVNDFIALYEKWQGLLADVDRNNNEAVAEIIMANIYDKVDVMNYPN